MAKVNYHKTYYDRQLKIHRKLFLRNGGVVIHPEIRLCGKWLEKLGFRNGKTVLVDCRKKRITIKLIEKK